MIVRLSIISFVAIAGFSGSAGASSFATIAPPSASPSIIHLGTPAPQFAARPVAAQPVAKVTPASVAGGMELTPLVYLEETPPELARHALPSGAVLSASIIALGEPGVEDMKVAAVPKKPPHQSMPFVIRAGLWGDASAEPAKTERAPADPATPPPVPAPAQTPVQAPAQSRPEPAPNLTRIR